MRQLLSWHILKVCEESWKIGDTFQPKEWQISLGVQDDADTMMDDLVIPIKVDVREFNKLDNEKEENR